jgi:nicotinamide-nucleotide amidase
MTGGRVFCHFTLNCFGAGESDIEAMIPPEIMRRGRDPLVGITASQATISLRASTSADSDELCHNALRPTIEQLRAVLGDLVYGEQDEPLESVVLRQMHKAKRTIAVADFGLEGTFFQSLRRHDSAGESMRGGLQLDGTSSACVFPDTSQYQGDQDRWLAEVAAQVRRMFETELGLAIGPLPAVNHRDQTFPIALVASQRRWAKELSCAGHPAIRLVRANKQVLNFLRLEVLRA